MAIPSLLRARRSANRPTEQTLQVVCFSLRAQWFALPMTAVQRVESLKFSEGELAPIYEPPISELASTGQQVSGQKTSGQQRSEQPAFFDNQPLVLISAAQRIFSEALEPRNGKTAPLDPAPSDCFLIVIETTNGRFFGLTISSSPKMQRIALKDISPFLPTLSDTGSVIGSVQCVSKVVNQPDGPQLLLLDPDLLRANV